MYMHGYCLCEDNEAIEIVGAERFLTYTGLVLVDGNIFHVSFNCKFTLDLCGKSMNLYYVN